MATTPPSRDEEIPLPGELDPREYYRRAGRVVDRLLRGRPRAARRLVRDMTAINPEFAALVMWRLTATDASRSPT